jgi:hypothetical protein
MIAKPRLVLEPDPMHKSMWRCFGGLQAGGMYGWTPAEAYARWLKNEKLRMRLRAAANAKPPTP